VAGGGRGLSGHFLGHGQALLGRRPGLAVRRPFRPRRRRPGMILSDRVIPSRPETRTDLQGMVLQDAAVASEAPSRDSIFCTGIGIASAEERAAYIARACGDDPELRRGVEKLVAAHFRAGSFLEAPAPALMAPVEGRPLTEGPGVVVGPYK